MIEGQKFDEGKQPYYAMPLEVLKPLADVFAAGERKYQTFNCLQPFMDADRRFYDGQMRHTEQCQLDPLAIDEETGCYHAAQVAFNTLMRLYHARKEAMKVKSYDIILRHVEGYGWLPIIEKDGQETYRGEYQTSPQFALWRAFEWEGNQCQQSLD